MDILHYIWHASTYSRSLGKGSKKKLVDLSTKGWVGGLGGGQNPLKKTKKNMPLKSILGHFKPF